MFLGLYWFLGVGLKHRRAGLTEGARRATGVSPAASRLTGGDRWSKFEGRRHEDGRRDIGGSKAATSFPGGEVPDFCGSDPGEGEWGGGRSASALGDSFKRFGSDQADGGGELDRSLSGAKESEGEGGGGSSPSEREGAIRGDDFGAGSGIGIA